MVAKKATAPEPEVKPEVKVVEKVVEKEVHVPVVLDNPADVSLEDQAKKRGLE